MATLSPGMICTPATCTGLMQVRNVVTAEYARNSSSKASGICAGLARSCRWCCGFSAKCRKCSPMLVDTVSMPPTKSPKQKPINSSSVSFRLRLLRSAGLMPSQGEL